MAEQFPDFSASVPLLMLFLYLESCAHRCPSSLPPLALITMLIFSRPSDLSRSFQMPPLLGGIFPALWASAEHRSTANLWTLHYGHGILESLYPYPIFHCLSSRTFFPMVLTQSLVSSRLSTHTCWFDTSVKKKQQSKMPFGCSQNVSGRSGNKIQGFGLLSSFSWICTNIAWKLEISIIEHHRNLIKKTQVYLLLPIEIWQSIFPNLNEGSGT